VDDNRYDFGKSIFQLFCDTTKFVHNNKKNYTTGVHTTEVVQDKERMDR